MSCPWPTTVRLPPATLLFCGGLGGSPPPPALPVPSEAPTVMVGNCSSSWNGLVSLSKSLKSELLAEARDPKKPLSETLVTLLLTMSNTWAGVTMVGLLVVVGSEVNQFQVVDRKVVISGSVVVVVLLVVVVVLTCWQVWSITQFSLESVLKNLG